WPRLTIAMTAPTPIMIPSIVKMERILFLFNALRAIFRMTHRLMALASSQSRTTSSYNRLIHFVAQQISVLHVDDARGVGCDVVFVSDHNQSDSFFAVQQLQKFHDFLRSGAIQIAGWLVGEQNGG